MRPCQAILVLEDLRKSFSGPLYRKGIELSLNDSQTVLEVYQQWLLLTIDLGYLHHETLKRDAGRLFADLANSDVLTLNNAFTELLRAIQRKNFKGFKVLCSGISSHLYPMVKVDKERVANGDVYAAKRLIQLFSYTSRLTLRDIDLTQQCLEEYLEVEESIPTYFPSLLIQSLNSIIKRWMKPFDPQLISFHHGPGGVAGHGRTSLEVKYKDLTFDELTSYAFGSPTWFDGWPRSSLDRISQTVFVPKSYKTFRTISMESSTLQYLQQGVMGEIDRVVSADSYLRNRIGSHDQTRNQILAQSGSVSRGFATIDLSSASDSVSYGLTKALFRGTKLLRYLVATRSRRTLLPDGRLVELRKFAPMGSALCFPIETLIFAAICQYVTREHGVTGKYSVYGDDIIVPTECSSDVMYVLEVLGFRINHAKSFYSPECWFRESCGAEFCDGFDVTPLRVSRKYNHVTLSVQAEGLVSMANSAYERGYRFLRTFFLRKMRRIGYIPLFSPTSALSDNYTNYHTERRWNRDLQRIECKVTLPQAEYLGDYNELIRLRHWLESTHLRLVADDGFFSETRRPTVLLKDRWLEKPYEGDDQPFIDHFTVGGDN